MNILKLKTILFSLLAIAMVTVFLTSCEKEPINTIENVLLTDDILELPNNFDPDSGELIDYLDGLDLEIKTDTQQGEIESRGCGSYYQVSGCLMRKYCTYKGKPFYFYRNPCSGYSYIVWL